MVISRAIDVRDNNKNDATLPKSKCIIIDIISGDKMWLVKKGDYILNSPIIGCHVVSCQGLFLYNMIE